MSFQFRDSNKTLLEANSTSGTFCIMLPGSHTPLQLWSELASLRWDVCSCHLKVIIESLLEDHRLIQESVFHLKCLEGLKSLTTLGWGQVNCDLPKGRAAWLRSSFDWLTGGPGWAWVDGFYPADSCGSKSFEQALCKLFGGKTFKLVELVVTTAFKHHVDWLGSRLVYIYIYCRYSCAYQKHFPTVSASRRSLPNACWNHSCGKQVGLVVEPLQEVLLELEFLTQWSTHGRAEISWKFRHRDALPNEYAPCCMSHHESCADFCACLHVAQGQFARLWSCRSTWRFDAWTSYCLCLSDRSALSGRPKACCTCFCCHRLLYDTTKS